MPDMVDVQLRLYSPRWGREEVCSFNLERERAAFELRGKTATCSWPEGYDPVWTDDTTGGRNPVEKILENDKVYPPTIFVRALECAWEAWRDGKLDNAGVQREIDQLCQWVNESTRQRPRTDFWRKGF